VVSIVALQEIKMNTPNQLQRSRNICRPVFLSIALVLAIDPAAAGEGKKLTNAELKEMTSEVLFYAGRSVSGTRWVISSFPNGTRELYWTNGVSSAISKGKWWIDGDRICSSQENLYSERCHEWRKSGDSMESWRGNQKAACFHILQ